jgi:hypothetical protein
MLQPDLRPQQQSGLDNAKNHQDENWQRDRRFNEHGALRIIV